jgi:hypothetical protein
MEPYGRIVLESERPFVAWPFVLRSLFTFFLCSGNLFQLHATCRGCTSIGSGITWAVNNSPLVEEASGLAVSSKTPGVIWTHNDDNDDPFLFAVHTNGTLLARFYHNSTLNDVEDMAVDPGPSNGVSYLYLGDIGGKFSANEVRNSVKILCIPEPAVNLSWASAPHFFDVFANVQSFTLVYPDGSFDAETLMLDPVTADLFVGTKQNNITRIYRANLNTATNNQTLLMTHVATASFDDASGGAISANGGRIILRNEDEARMWIRCEAKLSRKLWLAAALPSR